MDLKKEFIEEIVSTYDTPLQFYDGDKIKDRCIEYSNVFNKYFKEIGYKQYFAVKALPNPNILKIIYDCGHGFDCSSPAEIFIAKQIVGVSDNNIIYTSNFTSVKDLKYALENNVIINLDDIDGIDNILKTGMPFPKTLSFRINPKFGRTDSGMKSNILSGTDSKFGLCEDKLIEAYSLALKNGVTKFGIHMMTGSCTLDETYWSKNVVPKIFDYVNILYKKLGIICEFINIGGGFGISYKPDTKVLDLNLTVDNIYNAYIDCIKLYDLPFKPKLLTENGRYITGPFGTLISKCCSVKVSYDDTIFYGLDACMANLMRCGMYGAYHHISVIGDDINKEKNIKCNIVGTLCENNDWFAKDRELPVGIKKGDIFLIHDTGAHSHSMGFQYNGKLRAPEIMLFNGKVNLIRKREDFDSLFGNVVY